MSMRVKQNSSSAGSPCDFTVHVERYSRYITNSGHIDVITVHCKLADGTSTKSFSFPLKELSSFDWREQCPAARFDVNRSTAFVQRYTKAGILSLVNQELCCDFTHILVTEGIDLDSNLVPLCGAI